MNESTANIVNLQMSAKFHKKNECLLTAADLIASRQITGMSIRQVAAEIYSNAFIYYVFPHLPEVLRKTGLIQRAFNAAIAGIDLNSNGTCLKNRIAYSLIWKLC